jgi:hypothetical protein
MRSIAMNKPWRNPLSKVAGEALDLPIIVTHGIKPAPPAVLGFSGEGRFALLLGRAPLFSFRERARRSRAQWFAGWRRGCVAIIGHGACFTA